MSTCKACSAALPPRARAAGRAREYCDQQCYNQQRIASLRAASPPRICEQCGGEYLSHLPTSTCCSKRCANIRKNQKRWSSAPRLCPTCAVPLVRKGDHAFSTYCSRRCAGIANGAARFAAGREQREERKAARRAELAARTHSLQCEECGSAFTAPSPRACCSPECRMARARRSQAPVRHGYQPRKPYTLRVPTEHVCAECHGSFIGLRRQQFCSARCNRKSKKRLRDVGGRLGSERFSPREIFERDNWTCHLCGDHCDRAASVPARLAPTLDHLTPISKGGVHSRANVKCAHFSCNSKRGARDLQLAECA